jgi:hypothetical protein
LNGTFCYHAQVLFKGSYQKLQLQRMVFITREMLLFIFWNMMLMILNSSMSSGPPDRDLPDNSNSGHVLCLCKLLPDFTNFRTFCREKASQQHLFQLLPFLWDTCHTPSLQNARTPFCAPFHRPSSLNHPLPIPSLDSSLP